MSVSKMDALMFQHQLDSVTIRSRNMDIPGAGMVTFSRTGVQLAKNFSLRLIGQSMVQPKDLSAPPHEEWHMQIKKVTPAGLRETYSIISRASDIVEAFPVWLTMALNVDTLAPISDPKLGESPFSAQFESDPKFADALLLSVLAASSSDFAHLSPTYTTKGFSDDAGHTFLEGQLCSSGPIEICREVTTKEGVTAYRCRVASLTRPGFYDYSTEDVSWADLHINGNYHFKSDRQISTLNVGKLAFVMLEKFESLSERQRISQGNDEWTQPAREAQAAREKHSFFRQD